MGLREDRNYLKERKEFKRTLAENARKQEIENMNKLREEIDNALKKFREMVKEFKETGSKPVNNENIDIVSF